MNLIEIERLVQRLVEVLNQPGLDPRAAKWAQNYAELCQQASHRLEQCRQVMAAGDEYQAIQLAEAPPALVGLLPVLAFPKSPAWRVFCQSNGLSVAESFDDQDLHYLNEVYSRGIHLQPALYKEFRDAMWRGDEERALRIIQTLAKLNPADTNARQESVRLQERTFRSRMERLAELLRAGDRAAVLAQIETIVDAGRIPAATDPTWRAARGLQCQWLWDRLLVARQNEDWQDGLWLVDEIKRLCEGTELSLVVGPMAQFAALEQWTLSAAEASKEAARYQRGLAELWRLVAAHEARQISTSSYTLIEARNTLDLLQHKYAEISRSDHALPEDLETRLRSAARSLQTMILQKTRARRTLLILAVLGAALATGILAFQFIKRQGARDTIAAMESLQQRGEVLALKKFLDESPGLSTAAAARPNLAAALHSAREYVRREYQNKSEFDTLFTNLTIQVRQAHLQTARRIQEGITEISRRMGATLAKDFHGDAQARMSVLTNEWDRWVSQQRNADSIRFGELLDQAEATAKTNLNYAEGTARLKVGVADLRRQLIPLEALTDPPLEGLSLPGALLRRWESLKRQCDNSARMLEQWEQAQTILSARASLADYVTAIKILSESSLASAAQAQAAAEALRAVYTEDLVHTALLAPGRTMNWDALRRPGGEALPRPVDAVPAERRIFNELRDDNNIHQMNFCRLVYTASALTPAARDRFLLCKGDLTKNLLGYTVGLFYSPTDAPNDLDFRTNAYYVNPEVKLVGRMREGLMYDRIGVKDLIDGQTGKYAGDLLAVLDRINLEPQVNPVFKAFLFIKLMQVVDLRHQEWGAEWSPSLAIHRDRLAQLGAHQIQSGDWLIPSRTNLWQEPLRNHFAQAAKVSYMREAAFHIGLCRQVLECGFEVVGHRRPDGTMQMVEAGLGTDAIYGWTQPDRPPLPLSYKDQRTGQWKTVQPAMSYSPLLALRADRRAVFNRALGMAGISAAAIQSQRPPLFEHLDE